MAERHGNIDRKEYYYVIKAWQDEDGKNYYLFDHDTCSIRFSEGVVWNNKIGEWGHMENSDLDQQFCDELWEKLNMEKGSEKIIFRIQDEIEEIENAIEAAKEV